jgi:addiction module RelB/DinJ family antitoxin
MKTSVINFKTDEQTKLKAQAVSKQLGIPLSNLLNAYLSELAATGSVHFTIAEPMTNEMETAIEQAESEIANGETSGPFETLEDLFDHLDSLK